MPDDNDLLRKARDRSLRQTYKDSLRPPEGGGSLLRASATLDDKVADAQLKRELDAELQKRAQLRKAADHVQAKEDVAEGRQPRNRLPEATTQEEVEQLTAQRALVAVFRDITNPLAANSTSGPGRQQYRRENKVIGGVREANVPLLVSKSGALIGAEISTNPTAQMTSARSV